MDMKFTNLLIYFVSVVHHFSVLECRDVFFLVHNYDQAKSYCITNTSYGLSWIEEDETSAQSRSETISKSKQNGRWERSLIESIKNKNERTVNALVLDHRWEAIPLVNVDEDTSQHFVPVNIKIANDFIPFSVRTVKYANIFFCDGDSVQHATCYSLKIYAKDKFSEIDKVENGQYKTKQNIIREMKSIVENEWSHFVVKNEKGKFVLMHVNKNSYEPVLDYEQITNITKIFIPRRKNTALWKFHEIRPLIFVGEEFKEMRFGPALDPTDGLVCVSFFVVMDPQCVLTLKMSKANNQNEVLKEQKYQGKINQWTGVTFSERLIKQEPVAFSLDYSCRYSQSAHLAIDNVTLCGQNDFRMISSTRKGKCQLLTGDQNDVISLEDAENQETSDFNVAKEIQSLYKDSVAMPPPDQNSSEDTRAKICEKYENQVRCSCSASYLGKDCVSIPEKVRNLNFVGIASGTVRLEWERPLQVNGDFSHYVVEYQFISYSKCTTTGPSSPPTTLNVTVPFVELPQLIAFAKYSFSVSAANSQYRGLSQTVFGTTPETHDVFDDETPEILAITPKNVSAEVELSSVECSKFRGPLWINVTTTCLNEWCRDTTSQNFQYESNSTLIVLPNLVPFSNYTLKIRFCRSKVSCSNIVKKRQFQTKAAAPGSVLSLLVYSKNDSTISFRWRPPYPPRGVLEYYRIDCGRISKRLQVNSSCALWPEYQCFTLSNLDKNKSYNISVRAKNKQSHDLSPPLYTKATTSIEPSDAPLDATIHWTPKDSLVLTWEHPNVANGDIKFFTISIAETEKETNRVTKMFNATDKRYSLRYQYEARVHLLPSTRYTISISANNGCEGKEVTFEETSPPSTPKFETVPRISSVGDKIVLETVSIRNSTDQRVSQRRLYVLVLDQSENDLQFSELLNSSASRVVLENVADCDGHLNVSLQLGSCYNITIILTNSFANKRRQSSYSQFVCHSEQDGSLSMVLIYWPLSIALIFLLVVILYIAYRRKSARKHLENQENELSNPLREGPNAWKDDERGAKIYSKPVKTTDFLDYVKSSWKNGDLVRQHEEILNEGSTYETITENLWLDYIDTEFMDGQQVRKSHLAGKVPEPDQFALFWKLIWNENITHIILLDNCYDGDETSAGSYWLVNDEDLQRHNLFLSCDSCDIFADYECRRFILTYKKTSRHIVLYRYCSWSNTSTPLSSLPLMPFFQTTSKIPLNPKSPILVQCSTGVEGTGFALLCDLCLRTASRDGTVDVLKTSHRLVKCDENLANNTNYYLLAHLVILEKCLKIDTSIKCDSFNTNMPMILSDRATHQFFKYVANTQWLDEKKYETKNKPVRKVHFITSYGPDCDDVSASWDMKTIDDFRCVGKFTLTKEPKPDSLFQFWNMIANKDISMIVSLNKISALQTWPDKNYSQIVLSKYITLEYQNSKTFKCYDWITAKIIIGDTTKTIEIIAVNNWSWDGSRPEDVSDFVNFCNETNTILKKSNSVLVMSHNGIKDSGLYIAMLYNMKKMEVEGVCDVPTSVRMVRRHSPEFAVDEKQFTFLFEAARNYLREVRLYEVN